MPEANAPARFTVAIATDVGRVRGHNEDFTWPAPGLLSDVAPPFIVAVADGMGGAPAGEVASREATLAAMELLLGGAGEQRARLVEAFAAASRRLAALVAEDPRRRGMGTTLVVAVIDGADALVANVGDSRAYVIRGGECTQVTEDHSWVSREVRAGRLSPREAKDHPNRNIITRVVWGEGAEGPDLYPVCLAPGDTLLLCTDGLSNMVSAAEVAAIGSHADLEGLAGKLIHRANENGGLDNITAALVRRLS